MQRDLMSIPDIGSRIARRAAQAGQKPKVYVELGQGAVRINVGECRDPRQSYPPALANSPEIGEAWDTHAWTTHHPIGSARLTSSWRHRLGALYQE